MGCEGGDFIDLTKGQACGKIGFLRRLKMTNPEPPDFGFGDTPEGRVFRELRRLDYEKQQARLLMQKRILIVILAIIAILLLFVICGRQIPVIWNNINDWAKGYGPMVALLSLIVGIAALFVGVGSFVVGISTLALTKATLSKEQ